MPGERRPPGPCSLGPVDGQVTISAITLGGLLPAGMPPPPRDPGPPVRGHGTVLRVGFPPGAVPAAGSPPAPPRGTRGWPDGRPREPPRRRDSTRTLSPLRSDSVALALLHTCHLWRWLQLPDESQGAADRRIAARGRRASPTGASSGNGTCSVVPGRRTYTQPGAWLRARSSGQFTTERSVGHGRCSRAFAQGSLAGTRLAPRSPRLAAGGRKGCPSGDVAYLDVLGRVDAGSW